MLTQTCSHWFVWLLRHSFTSKVHFYVVPHHPLKISKIYLAGTCTPTSRSWWRWRKFQACLGVHNSTPRWWCRKEQNCLQISWPEDHQNLPGMCLCLPPSSTLRKTCSHWWRCGRWYSTLARGWWVGWLASKCHSRDHLCFNAFFSISFIMCWVKLN